jgi:hypothetical protein
VFDFLALVDESLWTELAQMQSVGEGLELASREGLGEILLSQRDTLELLEGHHAPSDGLEATLQIQWLESSSRLRPDRAMQVRSG